MTGYGIKGLITFVLIILLLLGALFSGDFAGAGTIFLLLIVGMILYQAIRFAMRGTIGWDPHEGTTRSERRVQRDLEKILTESAGTREMAMKRRFKLLHNVTIRNIKCDLCRKRFRTEEGFSDHKKFKHSKIKIDL